MESMKYRSSADSLHKINDLLEHCWLGTGEIFLQCLCINHPSKYADEWILCQTRGSSHTVRTAKRLCPKNHPSCSPSRVLIPVLERVLPPISRPSPPTAAMAFRASRPSRYSLRPG